MLANFRQQFPEVAAVTSSAAAAAPARTATNGHADVSGTLPPERCVSRFRSFRQKRS